MKESLGQSPELLTASEELLAEFERVRNNFLEAFRDVKLPFPTDAADNYFTSHGLKTSPTVVVPFTEKGFSLAHDIAKSTLCPFPLVTSLLHPDRLDEDFTGAGFGFFVPAYGLCVMADTSKQYEQICGEAIAERYATGLYAHEQTHSAFHQQPHIVTETTTMGDVNKIYESSPLSGVASLEYDASSADLIYTPTWLDEATACYVEGQVAKNTLHNENCNGMYTHAEEWGGGMFHIDEHYVVRSPDHPDRPGFSGGAVAGQALENIDAALPGTIETIFKIARGEVEGQVFRHEMRRKVAPKLFQLMFTQQPYSTWTDIYNLSLDEKSYQ